MIIIRIVKEKSCGSDKRSDIAKHQDTKRGTSSHGDGFNLPGWLLNLQNSAHCVEPMRFMVLWHSAFVPFWSPVILNSWND